MRTGLAVAGHTGDGHRTNGTEHSEPLDDLSGVSLADAIEAGEVFRLRAAGCNA